METIQIDGQDYIVVSQDEVARATFSLATAIRGKKIPFHRVIALARGGVSIAQSVADLIGVKNISVIQSELYTGIGTKAKQPIMTQPLSVSIKDESVLLIDDLADSGESMLFAKEYLSMHGPSSILTATLATKPWTTYQPDFSELSAKAWIIFPWETRETIETLEDLWTKAGVTGTEVVQRLRTLGYSNLQIETFAHS